MMAETGLYKTSEGRSLVRDRYEKILSGWPVENKRTTVEIAVDGRQVITHVISCGPKEAPPLLLLHGTMSNSAAWMGDAAQWSRQFRLFAADLPGEPGLSSEERLSPAGDDYVLWLEGLLRELGYGDDPVCIVGQSLGAFAALKFATARPESVKKVSMLTVSGVAPVRGSFLLKALPLMLLGRLGKEKLNRLISHGVEIGAEAEEFGMLVSEHCRTMAEQIPLFTEEELVRLTMPLQYFGGDHDALLDTVKTADRLKKLAADVQVNILEDTGHVITGMTDRILEFMKDQD